MTRLRRSSASVTLGTKDPRTREYTRFEPVLDKRLRRIKTLRADATLNQVIAKINEILLSDVKDGLRNG